MLVHTCCAPDAAYVLGLLRENYDVTAYFYNPNIFPREEYALRAAETKKAAGLLGIRLLEGPYDNTRWFALTEKFKEDPEKGRRCDVCYAMRLEKTAHQASFLGLDFFTTVMSLSPWKKADTLNRLGMMFGRRHGVPFRGADFKKKDGFRKSVELSKSFGLSRQDYCGCIYSRRDKDTSRKKEK